MRIHTFILIMFLLAAKKHLGINITLACATYDACATIATCSTSNGIYIDYLGETSIPTVNIVHIPRVDSMTIRMKLSYCSISRIDSVCVNGKKEPWIGSPYEIKMLSFPGTYAIYGRNSASNPVFAGPFTLILDPVGIEEIVTIIPDNEISIFPNPVTDELNVISKITRIKTVRIYTATGQEKESFRITNPELKIYLGNYPPGVYFVYVTTLTDKVIMKKLIIR